MARFILPLLILFLPTYQIRWLIVGIPVTLLEVAIILSVLVCLLQTSGTVVYRLRYFFTDEYAPLRYAMALFVAGATVAAVLSPNTIAAAGIWKAYVIEPILVFYVVLWTIHTKAFSWKWLTNSFSLLLIVMGSGSILQWFHFLPIPSALWEARETFRATSIFPYPNAVALLVGPILPIVASAVVSSAWSKRSIVPLIGFLLGIIALYLSASTAGMIATLIGMLILLLLSSSGLARGSTNKALGFALLSIITAIVILLPNKPLENKLQFQTHSGILRQQQYAETYQLLRDHPLMAGGLANYQQAIEPYHNTKKSGEPLLYPHNFMLALWSEFGLLGLIAMIWILAIIGVTLYRDHRRYPSMITASLIAAWVILVAHGVVDIPYFKNDLSVVFWILIALSITITPGILPANAKEAP